MNTSVMFALVGVVAQVGIAGFAAASSIGHDSSDAQAAGSNGAHHNSGGNMMGGHGSGSGNMYDWNHQWSENYSNGSGPCGCMH